MNRNIVSIICLLALIIAGEAEDNYIPSVSGDNYWIMHGSPNLTASITGTDEFDRGDTVNLYVDLINYGRVMGFEKDKNAETSMERALAEKELDLDGAKTTAVGIIATMRSDNSDLEVKSGDQVVESLKAGDKTEEPLKFTIKIAKHAPAGIYPLALDLRYDYQYNAEVDADKYDPATQSLTGFRASFWYQKANQTVTVPVIVKSKADFLITDSHGELHVGQKKGEIQVTYKNIGEEPVTEAIARLSIFKPFTSTDDQAYMGTIEPGKEATVIFRVDVDSDATPKEYGINSEIKYTDLNGDTVISESMKIPVMVLPGESSLVLPVLGAAAAILAVAGYIYYRRRQRES